MTIRESKSGRGKSGQLRCDCGRLCLVAGKYGYEFKCPRCKRMHFIPYAPGMVCPREDDERKQE
ncbi:MAG: hypothetical protein PHO34_04410 [Candidatus Omnitrophica bacterium]|nr:hypothetical protein [Candidatus Omnitrophota bacterium]MDD5501154.1 hypothetical protein [Candidatus Omnitrophota bacterium]